MIVNKETFIVVWAGGRLIPVDSYLKDRADMITTMLLINNIEALSVCRMN